MNANRRPILRWLTTQLASYLEVPATAINPMVPLAEMGVDSVHAISLVGDVELHFDIDVDPTMIFDYPTLSAHRRIHQHRSRRAAAGGIRRLRRLPPTTKFAEPWIHAQQRSHLARNSGLSNVAYRDHYHQCTGLLSRRPWVGCRPVPIRRSTMISPRPSPSAA